MKFHKTIGILFLFISILAACQTEQGNLTSVKHENRYIFGVWKAPKTKSAQDVIADISANIQTYDQKKITEQQSSTSQNSETVAAYSPLPYLTTDQPETLLPKDGEVQDWVRSHKPTTYNPETLYKDRYHPSNMYPEIYHHYGFKAQAEVEYQSPKFGSEPYILLEIFDMGTPENAFGIFSVNSYPQPKYEWVGVKAIVSGKNLWFWKGKYFVQIEGYAIATDIRKAMIALAQVTAKRIKDPPQKVPFLELLPAQCIRGSEELFTTNWALQQINRTSPQTFPQMSDGAIGVMAQYTTSKSKNITEPYHVFVIQFSNVETAQLAYEQYRNALLSENVSFETDMKNGAILIRE